MALRLGVAARNAMADACVDLIDVGTNGTLEVRTGGQPATPATAVSGTLLATFALPDPAFGNAATGVCTLNGTPIVATGAAAGDAGWFRIKDSAGTAIYDGLCTVTGGGGSLQLNTVTISVGVDVQVTSGTFTMPMGS